MNQKILKDYAKLIVKMGANVQKGQDVIIHSNVSDEYFTKYVIEECYKAKARKVSVEWESDIESKLAYKYASVDTLTDIPDWKFKKLEYQCEKLPACIYIESSDPDAMNGVNQEKMTEVRRKNGPRIMEYRMKMDNKYQWVIVGIPGVKWAKKIFPELSEKKAMAQLWDAILKTTRVYGDPIQNWKEHNANLNNKKQILNSLNIKTLKYKSVNGTDFSIDLIPNVIFEAGDAYTFDGVVYNPNMPTEECFTTPNKNTANGVVMATKPLSVSGKLVTDFGFRFENGKAIEVISDKPEEKDILEKLIGLDEGASRLGEVALVPYDSPINQTGLLFYNTLYDENACCHLALGRGFEECIKDFDKLSDEERKAFDLNVSMIHIDFMIGSDDLSIVAETFDGKKVQIFKDGTWAI